MSLDTTPEIKRLEAGLKILMGIDIRPLTFGEICLLDTQITNLQLLILKKYDDLLRSLR